MTPAEVNTFLGWVRSGLTIGEAAAKVGRSAQTFHNRGQRDPVFRSRLDDARFGGETAWDRFVVLQAEGRSVSRAAGLAGLHKDAVYGRIGRDPAFRERISQAKLARVGDDKALIRDGLIANEDWHGLMKFYETFHRDVLPPGRK